MVRTAALLLVLSGSLLAGPAAAQFGGGLFGNAPPPRPPADIPNGSFPAQPPPVGYPGQNQYQPPPPPGRPSNGIQAQPLPPPPGGTAAPPPPPSQAVAPQPNRPRVVTPQPGNAAPPSPANTPPEQPADNTPPPPPDDTIITEMPTQKIANNRAVFSGLDKITGRIISFDAAIGETVQFGALQVTARVCYTRPPTEATNTDAFVEVDEVTLQGEIKRIFNGWMFASSPGLHAVEHPIYDVWLTDCAQPQQVQVAQPAPAPAPAPLGAQPKPRPPAPTRQPAAAPPQPR